MKVSNTLPIPANITFRKYRHEDHQQLFDLHVLAMKAINAYSGPRFDYDFKDLEGNYEGEIFVGELDDKIVAMGALRRISKSEVELRRVRVHPDCQRLGLGEALLSILEKRAIELGYQVIKLDTLPNQTAAQNFYKKNGYREVGHSYIEIWKIILFEKDLEGGEINEIYRSAKATDASYSVA